jgi:hypothetical protein
MRIEQEKTAKTEKKGFFTTDYTDLHGCCASESD